MQLDKYLHMSVYSSWTRLSVPVLWISNLTLLSASRAYWTISWTSWPGGFYSWSCHSPLPCFFLSSSLLCILDIVSLTDSTTSITDSSRLLFIIFSMEFVSLYDPRLWAASSSPITSNSWLTYSLANSWASSVSYCSVVSCFKVFDSYLLPFYVCYLLSFWLLSMT